MQCNLEKSLTEAIKGWGSNGKASRGPSLCYEIDSILYDEAVDLACSVIERWQTNLILFAGDINKKERWIIANRESYRTVVEQLLENEGDCHTTDLSCIGGCAFSLCADEDEEGVFNLLAIAWGLHEGCIEEIKKLRPDGVVFRGN